MTRSSLLHKRWVLILVLAIALLLVGSGCVASPAAAPAKPAPGPVLPAFLLKAPLNVRETYQLALANPDTLNWIPCYCGCGSEGHKNVRDCFVEEVRPDGTVVWDEMGYG